MSRPRLVSKMCQPGPVVLLALALGSVQSSAGESCNAALCTWTPDEVALPNTALFGSQQPESNYYDYHAVQEADDWSPQPRDARRDFAELAAKHGLYEPPAPVAVASDLPAVQRGHARFNVKVANFFRDEFQIECRTPLGPPTAGADHPAVLGPHAWVEVTGELLNGEPFLMKCLTTLPDAALSPVVQPTFAAERDRLMTRVEELTGLVDALHEHAQQTEDANHKLREAAIDASIDHDVKDLLAAVGLASIFISCMWLLVRLQLDLACSTPAGEEAAVHCAEATLKAAATNTTAADTKAVATNTAVACATKAVATNTAVTPVATKAVATSSAADTKAAATNTEELVVPFLPHLLANWDLVSVPDVAAEAEQADSDGEDELPELIAFDEFPEAFAPAAATQDIKELIDDMVDLSPANSSPGRVSTNFRGLSVESFEILDDYSQ
eukprot:TRINITY_DN6792_c0_g1_i1.p2 TRINITY_DN6792_c0_g1~~TRINITY_DN6792_c0_g1_i1.p2  ORF type:complete len:442 (-),score=162.14 TRINITY_DN6792_c0_g1_i1:430-1755(-)